MDVTPDGSVVVGASTFGKAPGQPAEAFRWSQDTEMQRIGDLGASAASWISDDGRVIAGSSDFGPFVWEEDSGTVFIGHDLPGEFASINKLAADGSRVFFQQFEQDEPPNLPIYNHYVWDRENGTRPLREFLESFGLAEAMAEWRFNPPGRRSLLVSEDGQTIIGRGINPAGEADLFYAYLGGSDMLFGDFNVNGQLDIADIDLLSAQVRLATHDTEFDLNSDSLVNVADRRIWVVDLAGTFFGDANLDGEFNSSDLVAVFEAGHYEDAVPLNSTWATGDWNGDAEFASGDLVMAFRDGGYEQGPRRVTDAVPEPKSLAMLLAGFVVIAHGCRNSRR